MVRCYQRRKHDFFSSLEICRARQGKGDYWLLVSEALHVSLLLLIVVLTRGWGYDCHETLDGCRWKVEGGLSGRLHYYYFERCYYWLGLEKGDPGRQEE